ncbi:MAG TPA: hypothetical protein VF824_12390 [Thermoanaerobaculia bacterium]
MPMQHYDDEALFEYVEGTSPREREIEQHLDDCTRCGSEVAGQRQMIAALGEPESWQETAPVSRQFVVDVMAFATRAREEEARAAAACDAIFTGPPAWWQQRLRSVAGTSSAGMVKELLARMREALASSPANALQMTAMAVQVANDLDVAAYPCDYVVKLRAQAYRDHAYVLSFMGRYPEALQFADRSQRLFDQVPLPEYDLARLALVRANIMRAIDRGSEAVALTREAAATFRRFGDDAKYLDARITEAATLYQTGAVEQALALWQELEADPALDELGAARLAHNIAICYAELRQPERTAEYIRRCLPQFELLGMETERTRSRWALGSALAASGKHREAIPILRQAWREFERLDLLADGALAALELAEALLVSGEHEEVAGICRDVIARFTTAGMASRAVTALSFLRESVAIGQATPSLVRHVHAFLRELPAEQPRLLAAPPAPPLP